MRRLLRPLVMGTLVLAACSGDGGTTTMSSEQATDSPSTQPEVTTTRVGDTGNLPFRACDLVSDREVESYLQVDIAGEPGPLADSGNAGVDDCFWQSTDSFENFSIQVFGDRDLSDTGFGDLFEVDNYGGIGDEAITLVDDTGRFNSIWVQAGGYVVACYPDQFTDEPVEIDGRGWDEFLPVCRTAVQSASA